MEKETEKQIRERREERKKVKKRNAARRKAKKKFFIVLRYLAVALVCVFLYSFAFINYMPIKREEAKVISVSEKSAEYANKISSMLFESGIRVETDNSDERIGYKIRLAQLEKVPYMFILGENEANSGKVSIRKRNGEEIKDLSFEDALAIIKQDINEKRI